MKRVWLFWVATLLLILLCGCKQKNETESPASERSDPFAVEGSGSSGVIAVDSLKNAYNPLTGISNMAGDRVGIRPVAVSVNNISLAWPQYGTSMADYIIETETEGGITRLLCVYADTREVPVIGSVRSLRDQFIEATYPLNPIIVHIGTSVYADRMIAAYDYRTLDAGNYPVSIWTDRVRLESYASEHCKFTGGEAINAGITAAGIAEESDSKISAFSFVGENDPPIVPGTGKADAVKYNFSSYYDGDFRYDAESGKYLKWQFGKPQLDAGNNNVQLSFNNVFLLFADISPIPGIALVQVDFLSGGEGYYFTEGYYEKIISLKKSGFESNFRFLKEDGSELLVNVGKTHLGIVDEDLISRLMISDEQE